MKARSYTDEQLVKAVAASTSWSQVYSAVGLSAKGQGPNAGPQLRARRMGLDTSHLDGRVGKKLTSDLAPPIAVPDNPPRNGAETAVAECIAWFTKRGHTVSVPLQPTSYDLVADWGDGLKKVQVKSGTTRVKIHKVAYRASLDEGTGGWRHETVPYTREEVDCFFIGCADGSKYLIPVDSVLGQKTVDLRGVYARYRLSP